MIRPAAVHDDDPFVSNDDQSDRDDARNRHEGYHTIRQGQQSIIDAGNDDTAGRDNAWTTRMERKLQNSWSPDDQLLLDHSSAHNEDPLWATCYAIFGLYPPQILPDGVCVDITNNGTIQTEDGRLLSNTNWSQMICVELSKLIKCPIFYRDLPFLKHALEYVLYLRCGMKQRKEKPAPPNCSKDLAGEIIRSLAQMFDDDNIGKKLGEATLKIQGQIEARYGNGPHPHMGFIAALEKLVKPGYHKDSPGLTPKDLQWISEAWKTYAESKELPRTVKIDLYRKGTLPKDKKEREEAMKIRNFDFKGAKKLYILGLRREAWKSIGGWSRGIHDLYGEAFEMGQNYALLQRVDSGDDGENDDRGDDGGVYIGGGQDDDGDDDEDDGIVPSRGSVHSNHSVDSRNFADSLRSVIPRRSVNPGGSVVSSRPVDSRPSIRSRHSIQSDSSSSMDYSADERQAATKSLSISTLKRRFPFAQEAHLNKKRHISPKNLVSSSEDNVIIPAAKSKQVKVPPFDIPSEIPTEAANIIWSKMAPNFAIVPVPSENAYPAYREGLVAASEYWESKNGLDLWDTISDEIKIEVMKGLLQSLKHFKYMVLPEDEALANSAYQIYTDLVSLREHLRRMQVHYILAVKLRSADVELVSCPARQPQENRWKKVGLPIEHVKPEDVAERDDPNEYAFDTRPAASRRWVSMVTVKSQVSRPEKTFMLAENEKALKEKAPCFDRPSFPHYLLFHPER